MIRSTACAAAVIAAAALLTGCSTGPAGPTLTGSPPVASATPRSFATSVPSPSPSRSPAVTAPAFSDLAGAGARAIAAPEGPDFIIAVDGTLYAGDVHGGMEAYDREGRQLFHLQVPGGPCAGMDVGFGALWSATCEASPGLVRLEMKTHRLDAVPIGGTVPDSEASIGVGEGGIWMIRRTSKDELILVDPGSGKVVKAVAAPLGGTGVRIGFGSVWVTSPSTNTVHRIDPSTLETIASVKVGRQPQFFCIGEGAVWTMDQVGGTVSRIDPSSNAVAATIKLGEVVEGGDISAGGGHVWLRAFRTLLFDIDPHTNTIVRRYGPPAGSGGVSAESDGVWLTAHDSGTLWWLPLP